MGAGPLVHQGDAEFSRTLTDATAYAGMSQDELGHTRALFNWMEDEFDLEEGQLEFGRDTDRIHNMELLDQPPQSRGDFVLCAFLAETALWRLLRYLQGRRRSSRCPTWSRTVARRPTSTSSAWTAG